MMAPLFLSLAVFVFLFLINFLIKNIDRILGKGIPLRIIFEYIGLNIAWIIALAVPMAVLVAALVAFGRLAADNEVTALRASGVSFLRMVVPALILSVAVAAFMIYFNNAVLPDFNHRARLLGSDIYRKRPDLNIEEGYFIDDLPKYSLLVRKKDREILRDITIYSKGNPATQTTITAKQGEISVEGSRVILALEDGEIHELNLQNVEEYRRIEFQRHIVTFEVSRMLLQRSNSARRGDREMSASMMLERVAGLRGNIAMVQEKIDAAARKQFDRYIQADDVIALASPHSRSVGTGSTSPPQAARYNAKRPSLSRQVEKAVRQIRSQLSIIDSYERQISRYMVEVHKKYAIPLACIVFTLVGAPLGVMARRGSLYVGFILSLFFFLTYWASLIGGEELADRRLISPFIAMWTPNILIGIGGLYLLLRTVREHEPGGLRRLFAALLARLRRLPGDA